MANILIQRSERVECVRYGVTFEWLDCPGAGFSFDCDEHGTIDRSQLAPEALPNLARCEALDGVRSTGIAKYEWSYRQPAIGKCSCGRRIELDHFTNACDCGWDYNSSGDLLAPRSQWGEETGEHLADILRIS